MLHHLPQRHRLTDSCRCVLHQFSRLIVNLSLTWSFNQWVGVSLCQNEFAASGFELPSS